MQKLDIKRGHFKNIDKGQLEEIMKNHFGGVTKEGDKLISNFGAMQPIRVWLLDKKVMCVEIETERTVDDATALKTIRVRNKFLFEATGFTSKERSKRLQKRAKKGTL